MSNTWFTADLHLGHKRVAELRGFEDTDVHDRVIMGNMNRLVNEGDNVWILGDLALGKSKQEMALETLKDFSERKNVTLHCIPGNHDPVHPMHRNISKWSKKYAEVFETVTPFARRKMNGADVWLSHFPWNGGGDHTIEDRHNTVRLNDDGQSWLIHGHTHSDIPLDADRRLIHVGLDARKLKPIDINRVLFEMGRRS